MYYGKQKYRRLWRHPGRYDWPANKLDADEQGSNGKARQQATTLMFKIKGIKKEVLEEED